MELRVFVWGLLIGAWVVGKESIESWDGRVKSISDGEARQGYLVRECTRCWKAAWLSDMLE